MMYRNSKAKNTIEKMCANSLSRKSIFFRRNLAINFVSTNIKIVKIKSINELTNIFNNSDIEFCFLLERASTLNLNPSKYDLTVIGTDYNGKVLTRSILKINEKVNIEWTDFGVKNLWFFNSNAIKKLDIKINSNISTRTAI